jgi:hypothetical protein
MSLKVEQKSVLGDVWIEQINIKDMAQLETLIAKHEKDGRNDELEMCETEYRVEDVVRKVKHSDKFSDTRKWLYETCLRKFRLQKLRKI